MSLPETKKWSHIEKVKNCPVEYCENCEFLEVEVTPEGLRYPICRKPFDSIQTVEGPKA